MDNVTHAFVGAAMGECAAPHGAAPRVRLAMMSLGVVAANAPDIDLVYTNIIEEPLGYLLHHRGHSHTLPGLVAIGILIWAGVRLVPALRSAAQGMERRWLVLIAAALASHLLMDTANGYGTHLLYPFSSRWVYGDAVFVLEPWCWALLGVALALNAGWRARVAIGVITLALIGGAGAIGLVPAVMVLVMFVVAGIAAFAIRTWDRRSRAAAALMAIAVIFLLMPAVSRVAKRTARTLGGVQDANVIDVLADANPGVPWCWSVLILERAEDPAKSLVARRATLVAHATRLGGRVLCLRPPRGADRRCGATIIPYRLASALGDRRRRAPRTRGGQLPRACMAAIRARAVRRRRAHPRLALREPRRSELHDDVARRRAGLPGVPDQLAAAARRRPGALIPHNSGL